jgi:hypothetical protein
MLIKAQVQEPEVIANAGPISAPVIEAVEPVHKPIVNNKNNAFAENQFDQSISIAENEENVRSQSEVQHEQQDSIVNSAVRPPKPILMPPPPPPRSFGPPPPDFDYYPPGSDLYGPPPHMDPDFFPGPPPPMGPPMGFDPGFRPLPPPPPPYHKKEKKEPTKTPNLGGNVYDVPTTTVALEPTHAPELKEIIKAKATPSIHADIAVEKNVHKNINIQEGENAVGPAGKGGVETFIAHTVIESGVTKVSQNQATGAAAFGSGSRFFPGGVMPMGNVDMVFPDIVINNANDINNANENQNQVAAANENANLNPNNAANQNANQNFNEFREFNEFNEVQNFREQQFAENNFMNFEEKKFFFVQQGATETVAVPVTHTVKHTEVIHGQTHIIPVPVTETVLEQVQLPGQTIVIENEKVVQLPGQTIVEKVQLPGQTIVEQVQLPGQTVVEQIYEYRTIELPGQTVVEKVQLPGQTYC